MNARVKRLSLVAALAVVPVLAVAPSAGAGAPPTVDGPVAAMSALCVAAGGESHFGPYGVTCAGPDDPELPQAWITLCETGLAQFFSTPPWDPYPSSGVDTWICYSPYAP